MQLSSSSIENITISELILLTNCQLIPVLTYRLMSQAVGLETLGRFDAEIWRNLCVHSRLTPGVSPKTRHMPRRSGGLGLHSLRVSAVKTAYNTAVRHLNFEGPPRAGEVIRSYLLSPTSNPILDRFVDSAQALGVKTHGWGPWNPCKVSQLEPGDVIEARADDGLFYQA